MNMRTFLIIALLNFAFVLTLLMLKWQQNNTEDVNLAEHNATIMQNATKLVPVKQNGIVKQGKTLPSTKNESSVTITEVAVLVNTCQSLIHVRAKLVANSWAKSFPSDRLVFASEKPSNDLLPHEVWVFPHNLAPARSNSPQDLKSKAYAEAQGRFLRALAKASEVFASSVKWVLLVDDDAFVHAKNLLSFLVKLNESKPVYYAEGTCGGNHSCGGGGLLISMVILQKAAVQMKNCQSRVRKERQ